MKVYKNTFVSKNIFQMMFWCSDDVWTLDITSFWLCYLTFDTDRKHAEMKCYYWTLFMTLYIRCLQVLGQSEYQCTR